MYNPLKYVDPTGEQYFGWDPSMSYRIEQEMRGVVLNFWHQCYDSAIATHHLTVAMANCLYGHGPETHGSGGGNHGSGGGGGYSTKPKSYNSNQIKIIVNSDHGMCVFSALGSMSTCWGDDGVGETTYQWANKDEDYYNHTGKHGYDPNNLIDFITWNPEGKYCNYEVSRIEVYDVFDCMEEGWVVAAMCTLSDYMVDLYGFSNGGHYVNINSCSIYNDGSVYIDFYDIPCNTFMTPYTSNQYNYFNLYDYKIQDRHNQPRQHNRLEKIGLIRIKLIP